MPVERPWIEAPAVGAPANGAAALADWLQSQVRELSGLSASAVTPDRPLVALGLDSLGAVELCHRVEARCGVELSLARLLEGQTLGEVADQIGAHAGGEGGPGRHVQAPDDAALAARGAELGEHPLSYGQRALWFLDRLAPENAAYNIAAAFRVRGEVDTAALARALERLVERHPMLRCAFHEAGGEPVQEVLAARDVEVADEPATGWSDERLVAHLEREAHRPFDLAREPLLRLALCRRPGAATAVLLVVHHIVADLWSLAVLERDLTAFYDTTRGLPAALPGPLPLRYTDYVRWQGEQLRGEEGERLWSYWRERLAGDLPILELPLDRPRPPRQTFRGGSRSLFLDAALSAEHQRLGRTAEATHFTVLLAGWGALLARFTGQADLLVGSPTDGRDRPELAEVVGYFVNPVVLRLDLAGAPGFAELLARARQSAAGAFAHRAFPFPLLVERLRPSRDTSRAPIFETLFAFERSRRGEGAELGAFALGEEGAAADLLGMAAESLSLPRRTAPFDLELVAAEARGRIGLSLRYAADLFDRTTALRLLSGLARLLAAAAADPGRPLADLEPSSDAERQQVLREWNDTAAAPGAESALQELFERQAARIPDSTALVVGGERLTYAELDRRANRLARHLRRRAVGPGLAVAVCLERGVELVVALLGILKAGAAYVPIDPSYPAERRLFLLADSGATIVVTREVLLPQLAGSAAAAVCVDSLREAIAREGGEALVPSPCSPRSPRHVAYLIYTSGSTGRPKGVEIEHRSALAFLRWARSLFPPGDLASTLAATSVCFDLSVFELFAPLSFGGSVHLVADPLAVAEGATGLTLINTVPSAMAELVRLAAVPAAVRTVNLAGEPLPAPLVEQIYEPGTVGRVLNLYGPTEDTTYSTWTVVRRGTAAPTIGRPIAGTRAYLVDRRWRPVPRGVPGELLLAGSGLARGYHGRPEITAERFLPDPFAEEAGDRLYRTGDLARYRTDGEIELLGRIDHQVKLRGYRIEPGEVEAALRLHPGIREAAIVLRGSRDDRHLVAYVVPRETPAPAAEALRTFVAAKLPAYMVPAAFVTLERLPLTPNGKLDRRALPDVEASRPVAYVAPRSGFEVALAAIWTEVLGTDRIGVHDNFFHLGGHSLNAARVLAKIRAGLGVQISMRSLFEAPTIAELTVAIVEECARQGDPRIVSELLAEAEKSA